MCTQTHIHLLVVPTYKKVRRYNVHTPICNMLCQEDFTIDQKQHTHHCVTQTAFSFGVEVGLIILLEKSRKYKRDGLEALPQGHQNKPKTSLSWQNQTSMGKKPQTSHKVRIKYTTGKLEEVLMVPIMYVSTSSSPSSVPQICASKTGWL